MNTTPIKNPIKYTEETQKILDIMYKNAPTKMTLPNGQKEDIPVTGNLGLLSLGYEGLLAIRKKREQELGDKIQFPLLKYSIEKDTNKIISLKQHKLK